MRLLLCLQGCLVLGDRMILYGGRKVTIIARKMDSMIVSFAGESLRDSEFVCCLSLFLRLVGSEFQLFLVVHLGLSKGKYFFLGLAVMVFAINFVQQF